MPQIFRDVRDAAPDTRLRSVADRNGDGRRLWQIFVDPNQLESAVLNLAINARDAMPEGGKLTIEAANVHLDEDYAAASRGAAGQYVGIVVSDGGTGMTPETRKAFDPFFTTKEVGPRNRAWPFAGVRLHQAVQRARENLQRAWRRHDGQNLFATPISHQRRPAKRNEPAQAPPRGAGETVLVVEDDADVRNYTIEMLRELGYMVVDAPDSAAGLRMFDAVPDIKLLVTDVGLPGMNGRQFADEAKRRRAGLKVLFISGYARNAIVHHGRLDPGVELLSKPYSFADFGCAGQANSRPKLLNGLRCFQIDQRHSTPRIVPFSHMRRDLYPARRSGAGEMWQATELLAFSIEIVSRRLGPYG